MKLKIIWIILVLAAFLRLWNLSNIPPHLTPDEAALGYNAYSILQTGRDEHGVFMPAVFKSFGDYKPGLYIYLTVPFVAVFGLNELSVRLPSALAGLIIVYLVFLISNKLFGQKIGLFASFVSSVTPWLIYFSRGAWEANLSLMLVLLGIYLFLKSFEKNKYFIFSIATFALSLIAYQGAKLSTGIVVLLLFIFYKKDVFEINKKYLFGGFLSGLIISTPILISLFSGQSGRLEVFSVFSYPRPKEYIQAMLDGGKENIGSFSYYFNHSETYNFIRGVFGRWFNHFSGKFLFFEGDFANPRHTAPYQGVLLISDILLIIFGVYALFKSKIDKEKLIFLLWLILAPLPAVLSRDQVHAVRSLNMAIPLAIVCAFGINEILNQINNLKLKNIGLSVFSAVYLIAFLYFVDSFFIHVSKHDSKLWEYGYKQIVETVAPIQKDYKTVKIQQSFAQPYIYFLFYQKYDPRKYQEQSSFTNSEYDLDVGYVTKLDNLEFVAIDWSVVRGDRGTLVVGDPIRIPPHDSNNEREFKVIKEIKYLNNIDTAFRIIEIK